METNSRRIAVNRNRVLSSLLLTVVLIASALGPVAVGHAHAQSEIPLTVSLPGIWEDILTPELLAEFESQHPGVKVYVTYSNRFLVSAAGRAPDG
jgi:ABC-type glycerol-3-phosphate transport system substrate-binding protein